MRQTFANEEAIFSEALSRPASERAAYLDQACGHNHALRTRVEELLAAGDAPEATLGPPLAGRERGAEEGPGSRIGRYKLLQKIGEGGCGVVYMAEQTEPVHRRLALKIIKLGMDTREVIARFEVERQALALMDHPNIAHVFDAGATETGRPYFVMELVRGVPITRYCDEQGLPTTQRLELFIQVCHAVQHAHQKGIIHRDLKPSNILVTVNDGVAVPKIIDFGIAKATQGRLTDRTVFTAFDQFVGTPTYMSPEQAVMTSLDVDTRSDIYSMGVLLYELLTGRTPFDTHDLVQAGLDEIRRRIRELDPPKPSTRLSTMEGNTLTETARRRHTEPPKLVSMVRGDLDWIVMRCLEKDRVRRYATATGLADDLQRYLGNQPVSASPPGSLYRLGKFARRHRAGVAAALTMTAAMILGTIIATWQAVRATKAEWRAELALDSASAAHRAEERARRLAEQRQQEAEAARAAEAEQRRNAEASAKQAQTAGTRSAHVAQFMKSLIAGVGPRAAKGRDTNLLRAILEETAQRSDTELAAEPLVAAEIRLTLGSTYHDLGDQVRAVAMFEGAIRLLRSLDAPEERMSGEALIGLGRSWWMLGKPREAEAALRQALETAQRLQDFELADRAAHPLASALRSLGRNEECVALLRQRLESARQQWGEPSLQVANALVGLGYTPHTVPGRSLNESIQLLRDAVAMFRQLDPSGTRVTGALNGLALTLTTARRYAEAEGIYRELVPLWRKKFGPEETNGYLALGNLASVLRQQGKLAEAEATYREIVATQRKYLGPEHPILASNAASLGSLLTVRRKWQEAEAALQEALGIQRKLGLSSSQAYTLFLLIGLQTARQDWDAAERTHRERLELIREVWGTESFAYLNTLSTRAKFLRQQNRPQEADEVERASEELRSRLGKSAHAGVVSGVGRRGDLLRQQGRLEDARDAYLAELAELRQRTGEHGESVCLLLYQLSQLHLAAGNYAAAEPVLREVLAASRTASGYKYVNSLHNLGYTLMRQGRLAEAETILREALGILQADPRSHVTATYTALALTLQLQDRHPEAAAVWREAIAYARSRYGEECEDVAAYNGSLARVLMKTGNFAEAEAPARESLALRERLAPESWRAAEARSDLGAVLSRLGRHAEAEPLLLAAFAAAEGRHVPNQPRFRQDIAARLADLYTAWGKPGQAADWTRTLRTLEPDI